MKIILNQKPGIFASIDMDKVRFQDVAKNPDGTYKLIFLFEHDSNFLNFDVTPEVYKTFLRQLLTNYGADHPDLATPQQVEKILKEIE